MLGLITLVSAVEALLNVSLLCVVNANYDSFVTLLLLIAEVSTEFAIFLGNYFLSDYALDSS